jgi:hypothetical protein
MNKDKVILSEDVSSLIPKGSLDNYVERVLAGGQTDLQILAYAHKVRHNVLISGDTGVGKTHSVSAHAESTGLPFVSIACNGATNPDQMFGQFKPSEDGNGFEWVDGIVTTLVRNGGVLLLDEVNFMKPDISAALHPLLDSRRTLTLVENGGEVIKAHEGFQAVACINPNYEGTRPLNEAFKNRFGIHLEYTYEGNNEDILVENRPALLELADKLRIARENGTIATPVSTNSLMEFGEFVEDLGLEFAISNFVNKFDIDERAAIKEYFDILIPQIANEFGEDVPDMFVNDVPQSNDLDDTDN